MSARPLIQEKFASIRKGLLEFLILKIIASDKVYVADMLRLLSTTEFATQEGTLYPLLLRLENEGAIASDWGPSANNRRARFYRLTAAGRRQLQAETRSWQETTALIARFFDMTAEDSR